MSVLPQLDLQHEVHQRFHSLLNVQLQVYGPPELELEYFARAIVPLCRREHHPFEHLDHCLEEGDLVALVSAVSVPELVEELHRTAGPHLEVGQAPWLDLALGSSKASIGPP